MQESLLKGLYTQNVDSSAIYMIGNQETEIDIYL